MVIEIGLTIWAWNRGWKGWALLPIAIGYSIGFIVGFILAGAGFEITDLGSLILIDLAVIAALIVMVAKGRKKPDAIPGNPVNPAYPAPQYPNNVNNPVNAAPQGNIQPATEVIPSTVVFRGSKFVLPDGSNIPLTDATKGLGRSDFGTIISPNYLNMISRQHFFIKYENGKYYIDDYDSVNGTKVNGLDIRGKGWQPLEDGDRVDVAGVLDLVYKNG